MRARTYLPLALATLSAPSIASAQVLSQVVGYLNVVTGLMLVAAFLCFGSGLSVYIARFGLVGRDLGIQQMSWGVSILFVLVIMLWGIRFVQTNPKLAMTILAFVVFAYLGKILFSVLTATAPKEDH